MLKILKQDSWYAQGLNFACTGCGKCCTGAPGYVWINSDEVEKIADYLKLSIEEFSQNYLRRVKGRLSLLERPKTYDCIFLKDNKCQIYSVRPTQCKTFPWWPQILKSKNEWKETAKMCEGIQPHAPLNTFDIIQKQLSIHLQDQPQP